MIDKCLACGAHRYSGSDQDQRTCVWREDGVLKESLRPEPRRRELAHEDAATIARRITELHQEAAWALVVSNCAAMKGMSQSSCNECGPSDPCKVCAIRRNEGTSTCLVCWIPGKSSKPCPTRT